MKNTVKKIAVGAVGIIAAGAVAIAVNNCQKEQPLKLDEAYAELETYREAGEKVKKEKGKIEIKNYKNNLKSLEKIK